MGDLDFDSWYLAERPKVVASIAAITGRPSLAEEAADEAFTRAVERWRRVSQMESPGGWVHRTALNVARRRFSRSLTERRLPAQGTPQSHSLMQQRG
ncbi:MAG TPA: sigma factor [Microthrixaceae bacterium]|nr:sigma factor [Microthrixaceae bacterium]